MTYYFGETPIFWDMARSKYSCSRNYSNDYHRKFVQRKQKDIRLFVGRMFFSIKLTRPSMSTSFQTSAVGNSYRLR